MYGDFGRRGGGGYQRRGDFFAGGYQRSHYDNGAGCMFCTGVPESQESHPRRQCSEFRQLKRNLSPSPYVQAKLKDQDEQGFAAAGFLLWKKGSGDHVEVLMAREYRHGNDNLNFLGGKRLRKAETAIEVALKKVDMESGKQLSRRALDGMKDAPLVHWSGSSSKYALFLFEVRSRRDCEVDVMAAGVRGEGVKRLEWVPCKDLETAAFTHRELHDFAVEMVTALSDRHCDVLGNIKELFETARSASEAVDVAESQENVSFDFDVIAALSTSASIARGVKTSGNTWGDIADAVKSLPKQDLRKLKLKFHPDRLSGQLKRDPTVLENDAATKAMQVLNQIMEMVNGPASKQPSRSLSSGSIFDTISELKQLIKRYTSGDTEDGGDKVAAAITAKLSEIKLR